MANTHYWQEGSFLEDRLDDFRGPSVCLHRDYQSYAPPDDDVTNPRVGRDGSPAQQA